MLLFKKFITNNLIINSIKILLILQMGTMMFSRRIPPVGDFGFPARLTYSGLNTGSRRTVRVSLEKLELLAGITIIQQDSADSLHFTRTDLETNVIGRAGHKDGTFQCLFKKA